MKITIDDVTAFRPCPNWTRERILKVSGGRSEVEASDLPGLNIGLSDLVWLTYNILQARGNRDEYMLAAALIEQCQGPRQVIQPLRLYAVREAQATASTNCVYTAAVAAAAAAVTEYAADVAATAAAAAAGKKELAAQREVCRVFLQSI